MLALKICFLLMFSWEAAVWHSNVRLEDKRRIYIWEFTHKGIFWRLDYDSFESSCRVFGYIINLPLCVEMFLIVECSGTLFCKSCNDVFFVSSRQCTMLCIVIAGMTIRLSRSLAHKQTKGQLRSRPRRQKPCGRRLCVFDYLKIYTVHYTLYTLHITPCIVIFGIFWSDSEFFTIIGYCTSFGCGDKRLASYLEMHLQVDW